MNLTQLETFVRVAELGSFSRAASALDIAQPALSRQVRALETELRQTLLWRNGRGVTLTDAGRRLFDHSVDILRRVAQVREEMGASRDTPSGRVVIGMPPSLCRRFTVPLIAHARDRLPEAKLAVVEGLSTNLTEWIVSGRVDIGLVHNPEPQAGLEIEPLLEEHLCLVRRRGRGRRDGRVAEHGRPLPLSELAGYPLIMPERRQSIRRLIETRALHAGVRLDVACEVSGIASIIELVAAGFGNAVLPLSALDASERPQRFIARPLADPPVISMLCLARSAQKRPGALTRHVAGLLRAWVASLATAGRN